MRYQVFWREIGAIIRIQRKRAGRTQRGMATDMGLHRPSYTLIEHGERTIDAAELIRICHVLNLDIDGLLREALAADPTPTHPWYGPNTKGNDGGEG